MRKLLEIFLCDGGTQYILRTWSPLRYTMLFLLFFWGGGRGVLLVQRRKSGLTGVFRQNDESFIRWYTTSKLMM